MAKKPSSPPLPVVKQFRLEEIEPAIEQLKRRAADVDAINRQTVQYGSPELEVLTQNVIKAVLEIFGAESPEYLEHQHLRIWRGNISMGMSPQAEHRGVVEGLDRTAIIIKNLIKQLEEKRDALRARAPQSSAPAAPTGLERVLRLLSRFHGVAIQLRTRHGERPPMTLSDEYDVQDLLRALLRLEFDDIRPEEWAPSYAGSSSRMDFLLKAEQVIIETKMTRKSLGAKEVGEELLVDLTKYRTHPDCKTLVCFVYDPEHRIQNPAGLEADLARSENGFVARVIISPKA